MPGKKPATTALAGNDESSDVEGTGEPRAAGAVGGGKKFFLVAVLGIVVAGVVVGAATLVFVEEVPSADGVDEGDNDDGDDTNLSSPLAAHQLP